MFLNCLLFDQLSDLWVDREGIGPLFVQVVAQTLLPSILEVHEFRIEIVTQLLFRLPLSLRLLLPHCLLLCCILLFLLGSLKECQWIVAVGLGTFLLMFELVLAEATAAKEVIIVVEVHVVCASVLRFGTATHEIVEVVEVVCDFLSELVLAFLLILMLLHISAIALSPAIFGTALKIVIATATESQARLCFLGLDVVDLLVGLFPFPNDLLLAEVGLLALVPVLNRGLSQPGLLLLSSLDAVDRGDVLSDSPVACLRPALVIDAVGTGCRNVHCI